MSKKRKKNKAPKVYVPDRTFVKQFNLPFDNDDELMVYLFEECEAIDSKGIGFVSRDAAYDSYIPHDVEEDVAVLVGNDKDNLYVIYVEDCRDGWCTDLIEGVFHNKEEALDAFGKLERQEENPKDVLFNLKKALKDDVWINVEMMSFGYGFNIEFNDRMILEKYVREDAEDLQAEIDRCKKLDDKLKAQVAYINSILKSKEFRGYQRYYVFEISVDGVDCTKEAHIPSRMQNTANRKVLDFFKESWIDEIREEFKQEITENKARWAETSRIYQYIETHECSKPPFDYKTAQKLFSYLENKLSFSMEGVSGCDGTMRLTKQWLMDVLHLDSEKTDYALAFLQKNGGFCDCEVLLNASEPEIWK